MKKINCDIIQDLLPLYVEDMVSETSRQAVETHLQECQACRAKADQMGADNISIYTDVQPLKKLKQTLKMHNIALAAISVFLTFAVICLVHGIFFLYSGDEMGYSILYFYLLMPLLAFICSLVTGMSKSNIKWSTPIVFGAVAYLLPLAVFHASDIIFIYTTIIPSILGLLIGVLCRYFRQKRKK